ncbi:MAG TPA: class I SAM-dependent methyltransferase [Opitutaceae bacterium]|jgi:SAM-dependent methyltransferase
MNFYRRSELDHAADARLRQYDTDVRAIVGPKFAWPVRMRDWELLRILDGLAKAPAGGRVLEVGSFNTYLAAYLASRGRDVIASDRLVARRRKSWLRRFGLAGAKPTEAPFGEWSSVLRRTGAHIRNLDATHLPFPDGTFSVVIALSVLEHIPNVEQAIAELYRVLAPGGKMLLTMDCAPTSKPYGKGVRYFTPSELETLFAKYPLTSEKAPPDFAQENWTYGGAQPVLPAFIEVTKA